MLACMLTFSVRRQCEAGRSNHEGHPVESLLLKRTGPGHGLYQLLPRLQSSTRPLARQSVPPLALRIGDHLSLSLLHSTSCWPSTFSQRATTPWRSCGSGSRTWSRRATPTGTFPSSSSPNHPLPKDPTQSRYRHKQAFLRSRVYLHSHQTLLSHARI